MTIEVIQNLLILTPYFRGQIQSHIVDIVGEWIVEQGDKEPVEKLRDWLKAKEWNGEYAKTVQIPRFIALCEKCLAEMEFPLIEPDKFEMHRVSDFENYISRLEAFVKVDWVSRVMDLTGTYTAEEIEGDEAREVYLYGGFSQFFDWENAVRLLAKDMSFSDGINFGRMFVLGRQTIVENPCIGTRAGGISLYAHLNIETNVWTVDWGASVTELEAYFKSRGMNNAIYMIATLATAGKNTYFIYSDGFSSPFISGEK